MVAEVSVKVKNEDKTLNTQHLIYDKFYASEDDPTIQRLVKETCDHFLLSAEEITDVRVTIKLECT